MAKRRGPSGPTGTTGASPGTTGGKTSKNPAMPSPAAASNKFGDRYGPKKGGRRGK